MYNTEAKELLQRYGFELKEVYNDTYTFENNRGDKVVFADERDPMFKILANARFKNYLNQVNLDDLRVWLVQNQTAVYSKSEIEAYSFGNTWFGQFLGAIKPDPVKVGSEIGNKITIALFMAAATVFGGAIAKTIADKIRKIGEKPVDESYADAVALVEQARNKIINSDNTLINNGINKENLNNIYSQIVKQEINKYEEIIENNKKKIEEIIHPYTNKFDSKAPRAKSYSKDNLESYSLKSSVVDGLKKLRNLSADFLETALVSGFKICAETTGREVGAGIRNEILKLDDEKAMWVAQDALATEVEDTYRTIQDEDDKRNFAQKIKDAIDPKKLEKKDAKFTLKDALADPKKQRKGYSEEGIKEGELETAAVDTATDAEKVYEIKSLYKEYADKLGLSDYEIDMIFDNNNLDQVVDSTYELIDDPSVSEPIMFDVKFAKLAKRHGMYSKKGK